MAASTVQRNKDGSEIWNLAYELPQTNLAAYGQPVPAVPIVVVPDSGKPAGALSYAAQQAKRGGAILLPQPPPSPLQQWIREEDIKENPAYCVGAPVRLCNMLASSSKIYNRLVGDIVHVSRGSHGDMIFDVRCPLIPSALLSKSLQRDKDHYAIPMSSTARRAAPENRKRVAELYGISAAVAEDAENDLGGTINPFILVGGVGSEKLEPLSGGQAGLSGPSAWVRPPIWGPPLSREEMDALEARRRSATTTYHHPLPGLGGTVGAHQAITPAMWGFAGQGGGAPFQPPVYPPVAYGGYGCSSGCAGVTRGHPSSSNVSSNGWGF
eukprot:TRINITY_DN49022_c0_g1_i1.p1 TRINITY_DN49022_c0_g1~~TRINITY_DN49022_c0_g1_i1.p1  ORF type:complete len:325 (+),score=40.28 TRINITY_DN49022_c0_g1_i1:100-1074(+)